jgi:DNA-binding protein H-NS
MTQKTYPQLLAELADLNMQIERAWRIEREVALAEIRAQMVEHGIKVNDLRKKHPPREKNAAAPGI